MSRPLRWAYGITTVPKRQHTTFSRTLESLTSSGFDKPTIFVDGKPPQGPNINFPCVWRGGDEPLKTLGNWWLGMWELYIRNPTAERYAMFQDDVVCVRNLKKYLEKVSYPKDSYLNLYAFPKNQKIADDNKYKGFFRASQNGLGAVALIFTREALLTLFKHPHMIDKPMTAGPRAWRCLDGGIVTAMKKSGWAEYCHNPSLVQHIGDVSSMGNSKHPKAASFPGEDFDALTLLGDTPKPPEKKREKKPCPKQKKPAVVDNRSLDPLMEAALAAVNYPAEKVEKWLTVSCKCNDERQDRFNALHRWAARVVRGKVEGPRDHLLKLLDEDCNDS